MTRDEKMKALTALWPDLKIEDGPVGHKVATFTRDGVPQTVTLPEAHLVDFLHRQSGKAKSS